jgi:phosphoribosyl-ATP pyrophosphohydrolase
MLRTAAYTEGLTFDRHPIVMRGHRLGKSHNMSDTLRPLDQLEQTIFARKSASDEKSYTATLLAGGVEKIGDKITEEAAEVVEAAGEQGEEGRQHTIREAGDVIYHLLVLLAARDVKLAEVEAELARRFGMSGLEEKANRK